MSNKLIQEIQLSDRGYSSGIKEAIDAVEKLGQENGITSATIKNVSKEMRSAQKYAEALSATYNQLSDEAKATDWGQQMAREIEAAIQKAGELQDLRSDIQRQVKNIASDTRIWDTAKEGVEVFAGGLQLAAGLVGTLTDNEQVAVNMINLAAAAQGTLNTVTALGNALQKESNIMHAVGVVQSKAAAAAATIEAAAKNKGTIATKAATVAQKAFNAVAKANPYVLLGTAALAAAGAVWGFASATGSSAYEQQKASEAADKQKEELMLVSEWCDRTGRSLEDLEKIQRKQPGLWSQMTAEAKAWREQERMSEEANKKLGDSIGDVTGRFMVLQKQWMSLSTVAEQKQFINDNQTAFNALGLSIRTVNDGYEAFIKNAPKVLAAIKSIAESDAYKDLYKDAIKAREAARINQREATEGKDFNYVNKADSHQSSVSTPDEWVRAGLKFGQDFNTSIIQNSLLQSYNLTREGMEKLNKFRRESAEKAIQDETDKMVAGYDKAIGEYEKKMEKAHEKALNAQRDLYGLVVANPTRTTTTTTKTTKEPPLKVYNDTVRELERKRAEGLIDDTEETQKKIDAINTYIDALLDNGNVTDADTKELERLKPVLRNLTKRLKTLKVQAEDTKIVNDANQEYSEELNRLNREREQGFLTEQEYTTRYIQAVSRLTDNYRKVTNASDELMESLAQRQKELKNLSVAKDLRQFNIAVEGLIDDFNRIAGGLPLGNDYYNQRREARNAVQTKALELNDMEASASVWNDLQGTQEQLQWIQDNSKIAIQLGVSKQDVDTIMGITDAFKTDREEVLALISAVDTLDRKLDDTNGQELLKIDDKQKQLEWIAANWRSVATVADASAMEKFKELSDVSKGSAEQLEALDDVIRQVGDNLRGKLWRKTWFSELRSLIEDNNDLLDDQEKKVHTLYDALEYVDRLNYARLFTAQDRDSQKGYIVNDAESVPFDVKLEYKDEVEKFLELLRNEKVELGVDIKAENYDEILEKLGPVMLTVDTETFHKVTAQLEKVQDALERDVDAVASQARVYINQPKTEQEVGDASNYSLRTTSYQRLQKQATTFDEGRGQVVNFQYTADTEKLNKALEESLAKYQQMEQILCEINEKNERLGANIDTEQMEEQMRSLEDTINGIHDKIQESLNFKINIEGVNTALDGLGGLSSYGASMATLDEQFKSISERGNSVSQMFERMGLIIQTVQSTIEAVNTVMSVANAIQDLSATKTMKSAAANTALAGAHAQEAAAETASIPTKEAAAVANKSLEASLLDLAAAQIFAAHAAVPFAGVGIATGLATAMYSAMAGFTATSKSLAMMANGGVVGGDGYHGDTTLIRANKGEMILNDHQQSNMFRLLNGAVASPADTGEVEFRIRGTELVGVLKNTNNKLLKLR